MEWPLGIGSRTLSLPVIAGGRRARCGAVPRSRPIQLGLGLCVPHTGEGGSHPDALAPVQHRSPLNPISDNDDSIHLRVCHRIAQLRYHNIFPITLLLAGFRCALLCQQEITLPQCHTHTHTHTPSHRTAVALTCLVTFLVFFPNASRQNPLRLVRATLIHPA